MVPAWLAALVLILLLAVFGVGGFLLRGTSARGERPTTGTKIQLLERDVERDPADSDSRLALGFAYQTEGRYQEALAQYERVLQEQPRDTAALYNKATILMQLDKAKEAEEVYWEVLETSPTHVLAAKSLGEYYAAKGQYRSLLVAVRPAAEAKPTMADLQYLVGTAYEKLGQPASAIVHYRQALAYVPDMREAREGLKRLGAL